MASSADGFTAAGDQLLQLLSYKDVAIRAKANAATAYAIIQVLLNRVKQRVRSQRTGGDSFKVMTESLTAVAREASVTQLAIDNMATEDEVRRILNVIGAIADVASVRIQQKAAQQPVNIPSFFAPLQGVTDGSDIQWPTSIPEHAFQLRWALDKIYHSVEPSNQKVVVILLQDLQILQGSMALLDQKVSCAYGHILDDIAPQKRPVFATEAWYTSRFQPQGAAKESDSTAAGSSSNGVGHFDRSQAADRPSLQVRDSLAKSLFPTRLAQNKHAQHPSLLDGYPTSALVPYVGLGPKPAPKHDLLRSPGNSPVKKKFKDELTAPVPQAVGQAGRADGPYNMFLLAEREKVQQDLRKSFPKDNIKGQLLTNFLSEIWTRMSAEEKAPFEARYKEEQEEERKEWQASVASRRSQHVIDENIRSLNRKTRLEGMKRCTTVLNAWNIYQSLKTKQYAPPHNAITRADAARRFNDPPPPARNGLPRAASARQMPHSSHPTMAMWDIPHPVTQTPYIPASQVQYPPQRSSLQARRAASKLQRPPQYLQPAAQSAQATSSAHELMKKANENMQRMMASSSMTTPGNFVDLTRNDTPPPPAKLSPARIGGDAKVNVSVTKLEKNK